jgi:hypothetical protein
MSGIRMPPARLAGSHSRSPGGYLPGLKTNYTDQIRKIESDVVSRVAAPSPQPRGLVRRNSQQCTSSRRAARAHILVSPATDRCDRLIFRKRPISKSDRGSGGRPWTLGQALRCSLHFLVLWF